MIERFYIAQVYRRPEIMPIFAHTFLIMTSKKHLILTLVVFIILAAFYRVMPFRQPGFVPHLAMALFAGAMIKDKVWAFLFPLMSMFISDAIYQVLYVYDLSPIKGFYAGQFTNYVLFACITAAGFFMKRISVFSVTFNSVAVAAGYFIVSNFLVWSGGGGYGRPQTFEGLVMCYVDALPFLKWNLLSALIFSAVLFGGWKLVEKRNRLAVG